MPMLKEGLDEDLIKNIEACKELSTIIRTSLGPNGVNKRVINHLDKLVVINDAASTVTELEIQHPAKPLALAAKAQQEKFGDGVNLTISFAGELLQNAEVLIKKGLDPIEIISGYTKAIKKTLEILEQLVESGSETMDVRNKEEVIFRMRAAVSSKQFRKEEEICSLVADACIQVCPQDPTNFNVDNVRVAKLLGGGLHDSLIVRGMVFKSNAVGSIKRMEKAKVAVFPGGVDTTPTETTVLIHSAEQLENSAKTEKAKVEELIKAVAESGAKVIVSGESVGEMALHFCERYNLMVLNISSNFELSLFCQIAGADAHLKLSRPSPDDLGYALGYVDSISVEEIGGVTLTIARNEEGGNSISTVVLRGSAYSILDDLERAVEAGVNTYKAMCRDSRIVPGAAATEIELAQRLKEYANAEIGLDKYAITKYAESFEFVPKTLADNAGLNAMEIIAALYTGHGSGNTKLGIDLKEGACKDVSETKVWDLFATKSFALKNASDAACTVLNEFGEADALSLISAYFEAYSPVRHQLESFNMFCEHSLQQIINEAPAVRIACNSTGNHTHTIRFGKITIQPPIITDPDGWTTPLLPQHARLRSCTYASPMSIDITIQDVGEQRETSLKLFIGKVPIMLQSNICKLHGKSPEDLIKAGECTYDKGGYFIIDGVEKVIVPQERRAPNRIFVQQKKQPSKYSFVGEVHSLGENHNSSQTLKVSLLSGSKLESVIHCTLPFIRSPLPIVIVFLALGISTEKEIITLICDDATDTEMVELLKPSLEEASYIRNKEVALEYIGRRGATDPINQEERIRFARDILQKKMLPHLGTSGAYEKKKAFNLGYIIKRLLLCALDRRLEDNRDHYSNKRLDLADALLGELFRKHFRIMRRDIESYAQKCVDNGKEINLECAIMARKVTQGFNYALSTGNWGRGLGNAADNRVGVSQVLNRGTYLSTLSHLRRTNSSIKHEGIVVKPRQLHTSQWGLMCPAETPRGDTCGLVKNMALMAHITGGNQMDVLDMFSFMDFEDINLISSTLSHTVKVFVNEMWIGVSPFSLTKTVETVKYHMKMPCHEISVVADYILNEVRINSDPGRCIRPLFTVQNLSLNIKKEHKRDSWESLIKKGFVEYLDAEEEETSMISISIENLAKSACGTYTHCEIHPSLILGICASVIPFVNHNQSSRNSRSMGKHAMGIYSMNYQSRMDTQSSILYYPQKPLVNTVFMNHLSLNELPEGTNAVVAIMYHDGYNEGDAIVMNQSSIDRGFFRSLSFRTYKDMESKERVFGRQSSMMKHLDEYGTQIKRPSRTMEHLDNDGLPCPGTRVPSNNNVIIGKTLRNHQDEDQDEDGQHSIKKRIRDTGIVDQVMLTTDVSTGFSSVKVRTRTVRTPQIGDKFSSRHSQKGVIGMTISQEDMPWTMQGITPDITINPRSIPSRMTVGQLWESLMGKMLATKALKKDVAPFTEATVDNIRKMLHGCEYQRDGLEKMYDGHTGRPITSMICVGSVYYQRLVQLVDDKIQSRGRGDIKILTRQPSKGRSEQGGLRFGEMERDSVISHGGALNLKERLFYQSDPYAVHVCRRCGYMMEENSLVCKSCRITTAAVQVQIPYAFKLLIQELMSMGIGLSLKT